MSTSSQNVAVITGCSSGIGYETSLMLARNGFQTFATMRNLSKRSGLESVAAKEGLPMHVTELDVTDDKSVNDGIQQILSKAGKIDVLVNNAGYALYGALEDLSTDELKAQYETNLFGIVRVTQAVLPSMRNQRSGIIVNVSTVGGRMGIPCISAYTSSKFAVEGLTESIAYELESFGIRVVLIEPGAINTNFTAGMVTAKKAQEPTSPYSQMMKNMSKTMQQIFERASHPELVAKVILGAISTEKTSLRYLVGKDAEGWIESKNKMTDNEFYDMMKQQFV
jgi:NAD(P)-dependent dehydrogenase (short-subunit alcohol dehydrogenase family)